MKRNKDFINALLNAIPIPVFYKDREGRYQGCNAAFTEILGVSSEEIEGKTVYELWPGEQARVYHQKDLELMENPQRQTYEFEVTNRHGEVRSVIFTKDMLYDESFEIQGMIGTFLDITERKKTEEALKESRERLRASEERFREAFAHAPVGMGITDLAGRFLEANDYFCRMVGWEREELLRSGLSFKDFTHPDDLEQNLIEWHRLLRGEIPAFFLEKRYVCKDGSFLWARTSVTVRKDHMGKPFQAVAIIENIHDRKRTEEELVKAKAAAEEATRAKSEFLANMSHEIRTPMTIFMAAVEHLLQIDRNPERLKLISMANQAAQRLRGLIDDILDFSRIEAGKIDIEEEPFELEPCVREVVEMFIIPARQKNLRLETDVAPDTPGMVIGDSKRLGQVLINLIGNAVKFTHQGKIRICIQPRSDLLEFAVSDTGIGIPEEKRALLFQSFSQVSSSVTRKYGGSGLGLAISRGLVEHMGGNISVRSEEGKGSTFVFTLPLKPVGSSLPAPVDSPSGGFRKAISPVRILLAEDEPLVREMITLMLEQQGCGVESAESGKEALEKWERGDFDIILMDLQMPEMDGLETTRMIREREAEGGSHATIIGLTANARSEVQEKCLASGMDLVLTKPVQVKDLLSAIATGI